MKFFQKNIFIQLFNTTFIITIISKDVETISQSSTHKHPNSIKDCKEAELFINIKCMQKIGLCINTEIGHSIKTCIDNSKYCIIFDKNTKNCQRCVQTHYATHDGQRGSYCILKKAHIALGIAAQIILVFMIIQGILFAIDYLIENWVQIKEKCIKRSESNNTKKHNINHNSPKIDILENQDEQKPDVDIQNDESGSIYKIVKVEKPHFIDKRCTFTKGAKRDDKKNNLKEKNRYMCVDKIQQKNPSFQEIKNDDTRKVSNDTSFGCVGKNETTKTDIRKVTVNVPLNQKKNKEIIDLKKFIK